MTMKAAIIIFIVFFAAIITATGFWPTVSTTILPNTTWGLYSRGFFENLLAGAHGTVIDLFIVGILLYWFQKRSEKKAEEQRIGAEKKASIERHKEILTDLRFYSGSDIAHRTLTAIKHLIDLGVSRISCSEAKLEEIKIENITLTDSNLRAISFFKSRLINIELNNCKCDAAIFIESKLKNVKFNNSVFARAKFNKAEMAGVDFRTCDIRRADFSDANLKSAIFSGVDCRGVNFEGADLRSANFSKAKNVTLEMLRKAKNTEYIQPSDFISNL